MAEAPTTYEKNFDLVISLRFVSQHVLDGVTIDTVKAHILKVLTHNDTITDVTVRKVEQAPSQLSKLIERLTVLQSTLDEIKKEVAGRND